MPEHTDTNTSSPSTTWGWRKVRITPPPQRPRKTAAEGGSDLPSAWDLREPLTLTVRHRGGAESWWEITARGRVWRRPGWQTLDDVLREVFAGTGGKRPAEPRASRSRPRR